MTLNPLLIKLFCLLSLFSFLNTCNKITPGTWKNEKIDESKRDDFHALNAELFNGLKENKLRFLESVLSKELLGDKSQLRVIEICSNHIKEGNYTLVDEYYVVNKEKGQKTLESNNPGINDYNLDYDAETREMYFAFFVPKSLANQSMISASYCKYNYGWKLSHLAIDQYTMNGKTAPELYKQAREAYNKKYLLDALDNIELAKTCLQPVAGWKYPENDKINAFYANTIDEINRKYVYPFTLTQVPTQPRIFSVGMRTTTEGVFPMVYYKTTIKLQDTAALRKENENIKKVIGKAIPGIDKDKKYVFYDAYNEWPRFDRSVDRYDMPDKRK